MSDGLLIAVVVIGRNEGARLLRCLDSVRGRAALVVYVDSGSTDGSIEAARERGAEALMLDRAQPFTAARARNAGWQRALAVRPDLQAIQFVDGDCELSVGWLDAAMAQLAAHPAVAGVCGQRRERFPRASIYNQLCDYEWRKAAGAVLHLGGDAMVRVQALLQVNGYRNDLIAGEEPELSVRLRARGWTLLALADDMTLHDAAILRFSQWWQRTRRSGYAYAHGAQLHGAAPERHFMRETRRALAWGLVLPMMVGLAWLWSGLAAAALLLIYPAQIARLWLRSSAPARERSLCAVFNTLARFPEVLGVLQFEADRLLGRRALLIEYK